MAENGPSPITPTWNLLHDFLAWLELQDLRIARIPESGDPEIVRGWAQTALVEDYLRATIPSLQALTEDRASEDSACP